MLSFAPHNIHYATGSQRLELPRYLRVKELLTARFNLAKRGCKNLEAQKETWKLALGKITWINSRGTDFFLALHPIRSA